MDRGVSRRAFLGRAAVIAGGLIAARSVPLSGRGAVGAVFGDALPSTPAAPPVSTGAIAAPTIITRAEWGADELRRRGSRAFAPVRKIGVHHTAMPSVGDSAADVRAVYDLHLTRDGGSWSDIGYHYLVDREGHVYEGRWARDYADGELHDGHDPFHRVVHGAHAVDYNTGSLGIALMGNYEGAAPSAAALGSLVELIAWLCQRHRLDPHGSEPFANAYGRVTGSLPTVFGHRDVKHTLCPGQTTYDLLPQIRNQAAERLTAAPPPPSGSYRVLHSQGNVSSVGSAADLGDPARLGASGVFLAVAGTPSDGGYWVLDAEGGVFTFGDAGYHGSVPELRAAGAVGPVRVVDLAATPGGGGYWVLDAEGGVFTFGDAGYHGSVPELRAAGTTPDAPARAVAIASTPGAGYWILDVNGRVHSFGDAPYLGSLADLRAGGVGPGWSPAVDLASTASGQGYWVLDARGGVFTFGDAGYHGSVPETGFRGAPAVELSPLADGSGYRIGCRDGAVLGFGQADFAGHAPHLECTAVAAG